MTSMQMDLIDRPVQLTRAAAREQALRDARLRAARGMAQAESGAEWSVPGWCALALDRVRAFAATNPGVFTVEQMRSVLQDELPTIPDARVWGRVTTMAVKAGFIERVPKVFLPAASSNASPKPAWRKGPKA